MKAGRYLAAAVLVLTASRGVAICAAEPTTADVPLVAEEVRQLMQDRKYAEAVEAIDRASQVEGAPRDYLAYLKGRAHLLGGQFDAAVGAFDALEKQYPGSPWLRRSRFAKAVALARKGDFKGAEQIYRAEAEFLLSQDRKQEIADIYLEFADAYFKPAKKEQEPDYQKSLEFFSHALAVGPKPEKQVEIELLVAECHQQLQQFAEAAALYEKFTKDHPDSPLDVDARFRLGTCQLAQGQLKEARRSWQDLLAKHAASDSKWVAEAAYQLSRTWRIPAPESDEELSAGVAVLEAFVQRFPDHQLASKSLLDLAESSMHRGRPEDAAVVLNRFLADQRYAGREEVPAARHLLGRAYRLQKKFDEALTAWRDYLAKHPADKAWSEALREVIDTEYLIGEEKAQAEQYAAAREIWSAFLTKYPLDDRSPQILYDFGRMNFQQEKWSEAIADWEQLASKYPETNEASQGLYMIGFVLEEKLGKLEESLEQYKKVTQGSHADQAKQAIARLTAKSLVIATDRVFRSDETPHITLTARNIEKVSVRVYKVDLQTYFRKMHLAQGLEQLDVSLIDPDATFEFAVPGYAKYQKFQCDVPVPLPAQLRSGVAAVTVSSDTLEATTMLIQSDLDVIVKSSRDELFVFAENMLTGQPWPAVKLLISDGKNVFAEATTGSDGVFQQAYDELKTAEDVRVFATVDTHTASNVVGLQGVGVASGLTDRGYIYTDRPAYRAGQIVHIRGCLRGVSNDAYRIDAGKQYVLEIFDGRNRLVHQADVTLNPFGSFHAHCVLPQTSPQGEYRVLVRDTDERSYQGSFLVHEFQLEPIRLVVDVPRTVYYRGEEIRGKIRAEYYYGAPLANAELRYRLADDRVHTARTDQKGEAEFTLPTREFLETQVLPLIVELPERNLQHVSNFLLASHGFSLRLETIRPVYVAGETFEVSVVAADAEGKPTGRKLTLKVFQQTTVQGKAGERLVGSHELETDPQQGSARQVLKLDEGGSYVLRAEGMDQFNNPISGQHVVQISDDKDQVRLRILAERHTYKVGDTATVKVHWREQPAMGLVTFQGARILGYRLIQLNNGVNELSVPMEARLAPNFELAVAVMTDVRTPSKDGGVPPTRFHESSSPFVVEQDLRLTVTAKRKAGGEGPIQPGEEVEVALTATDAQGRPVSAEVSLAMVEQSLLERFPASLAAIQDFFRGEFRQSAVRTGSSIQFTYHPATQAINARLLAEDDRLAVAADEAESRAAEMTLAEDLEARPGDQPAPAAQEPADADGAGPSVAFGFRLRDESGRAIAGDVEGAQSALTLSRARFGKPGQAAGRPVQSAGATPLGPVQIDFVEELGVLVLRGNSQDVSRVQQLMKDLQPSQRRELLLVDAAGSMRNMNLAFGTDVTDQFVAELGGPGAMLLPNLGWQETGYWNPAVVTNEQGQATVTFTVPQRSTAWKFLAKGITVDTQAGEGTGELLVKKDLFGQLKLPSAFTEGDEVTVPVSVHNQLLTEGKIEVSLKAAMGEWRVEELRTVDVTGKGIQELVFQVKLQRPQAKEDTTTTVAAQVEFELTVASGELRDVIRQAVPLQPFGMPVHAIAAGQADSDITAWVEPPAGMASAAPTLQILIGPTVEQSLLDTVLGPAPTCQFASQRIASGMESATSDLLAALALQQLMQGNQESGGPQVQSLDGRVRSAIGLLVSSQNDDGGWSWTGRAGTSHRFSAARAVWGLSLARQAGYGVPDETYNKAIDFLRNQATAVASDDYESSAVLLHAMATAGQGDFALANRLYRSRPALSAAALAHLTLAFAEMDRGATAGELLALLGQQNLDAQETRRRAGGGCLPWNHSPTELRALYALALQKVSPHDPAAKSAIDWLLANRTGHRWAPDKATGPATMALCAWFAQNRFDGEHYQLTVTVNDQPAARLDVDPTAGTQTIDVPAALLKDGKQRIHFQITGRGRYTYQCILGGFVPADKLVSTTKEWEIQRTYEPAPREFDGLEIPRGFDVLAGNYSTFRNPLAELPVGRRGLVELTIQRHNLPSNTPEEQLEYLVVTDPIPCGATVIDNSVTGSFERYEIAPGSITFYVGSRQHVGTIQYRLYGYVPGTYQAAPAVLVNAHRPDQFAVSERKQLTILPPGQETRDEYRLTPQELYELGRRSFEKGQLEPARQHLTDLVGNWNLKPDIYKHAVQMLLDAHLELGPASQIVHYFEIVKEKWPAEEIPFAKIVKVGAAYGEIGEFERSYLVFRATVASSFRRESGVAGFLEGQGEFARSVDVMLRLTRDYPPEPYIASAYYALAQRVYAKAPEAAADTKLREQKINRVDLVRRAAQMLETFLTDCPDDPAADQAAFSKANALLELKMYPETVAACNRFTQRYPDSDLLDSSWYMIGYCHFATGKHQEALEMCTKVAEAKRVDKNTGRETESPNKWQAIYILGQVHHSLGRAADAIREYERVQDRFADAKEAIDYFRHVTIHAPEVTTFKPGEPVEIELAFRNIPSCDVKVYRIDLMKLSLLKRDLAGITKVNLAGIRPHFETVVTLGDGKDYRDRTHRLAMPLAEEGAYLVVCRGEDLHTSGLVLVTPLAVDVQEDGPSGRVRTTVKDVAADSYVNAVHVKVIGSRNTDFVSGDTDLRGVFVADGILGTSTVIAQVKPSRYAFYRGSTELGPPPTAAQPPMADAAPAEEPAAKGQLLEELQRSNSVLQNEQMDLLKQTYESEDKGVQPSEAF